MHLYSDSLKIIITLNFEEIQNLQGRIQEKMEAKKGTEKLKKDKRKAFSNSQKVFLVTFFMVEKE